MDGRQASKKIFGNGLTLIKIYRTIFLCIDGRGYQSMPMINRFNWGGVLYAPVVGKEQKRSEKRKEFYLLRVVDKLCTSEQSGIEKAFFALE